MKTWIKRTLIGVFGAAVLFGSLAAYSHRDDHRRGWQAMTEADAAAFKGRMVERAGRYLSLDDAQKARLGVLADRLREQRNALVAGATDPRAELQALVAGPAFDRARAEALVIAKTDALRAGSPAVIAAAADFYDSLRPEQQAEVRDLMARGGRWGHERHGWRGHDDDERGERSERRSGDERS